MRFSGLCKETKVAFCKSWAEATVFYVLYGMLLGVSCLGIVGLSLYGIYNGVDILPVWMYLMMVPVVIVNALLITGYLKVMIKVACEEEFSYGELFRNCKYGIKALGIMVLSTIYTVLWSCLLVVPGIIKAYSYSMALYIYANDTSKSVNQCIKESSEMMKGHKMELFSLHMACLVVSAVLFLLVTIPYMICVFEIYNYVALMIITFIFCVVFPITMATCFTICSIANAKFYCTIMQEEQVVLKDDIEEDALVDMQVEVA